MTKNQLDNLIGFCFNFHKSMDSDINNLSPDYLLEKWNKYIGVCPIKSVSFENLHYTKWMSKWNFKIENDDNRIKEILNFIFEVNTKSFYIRKGIDAVEYLSDINYNKYKTWSPSGLLEIFRELIGDPEQINKDIYNHLHYIVKEKANEWLEHIEIKRDYKLNILL